MTKVSKKKIRGFDRKIKQLGSWKSFVISYPFNKLKNPNGTIFRVNLLPFIWCYDLNFNIKFHKYFYNTLLEILQNLKTNEVIKKKDLSIQLWLFYPRTVKSLIIVASKDHFVKLNDQIDTKEPKIKPPKVIEQLFEKYSLKIGVDNVFESDATKRENPKWLTHKLGDIWTID